MRILAKGVTKMAASKMALIQQFFCPKIATRIHACTKFSIQCPHQKCAHVRILVAIFGLLCHIWSSHIWSGRTKYDCNIWSGQNMTTNLLVIFRPPLQYFVCPTNYILRLPYHAWDHRISHNCKGRRNRSEFVIIFCPDQIFGPGGQNIFDEILVLAEKMTGPNMT